jgi:hypothetical protein
MPTAKQIENTRMAYSIMAGIPAEKVNLNVIRRVNNAVNPFASVTKSQLLHDCGTVGCIAGWLSAHPYFTAQGLRYRAGGIELYAESHRLFGVAFLFNSANSSLPGKTEALMRLRRHLLNFGAITPARDAELAREESRLAA